MFEGWGEYYLLVGSAGAALTGLLFVVATLTGDLDRSHALIGASVYMTPIVFHLAMIVVLSGVAMVPGIQGPAFGLTAGIIAILGIAYSVRIIIGIRGEVMGGAPHWSDVWFYGVGALLLYLALGLVSADLLLRGGEDTMAIAAIPMLMLLLCIRNAWDLVTWLAPKS